MNGIILAGGRGTRLGPSTSSTNKHLLPIYDKPMIYYPLTTLILAGAKNIQILSTSEAIPAFRKLLGDGSQWGVRIGYSVQDEPSGIAEALSIVLADIILEQSALVILGDNIFYGQGLGRQISEVSDFSTCHIWTQKVRNPESFGVAEYSKDGNLLAIREKPVEYIGDSAVTGLYIFPKNIYSHVDGLVKSGRNEFEITQVLNKYIDLGQMSTHMLSRGVYWTDAGTIENLSEATSFVRAVQLRQGVLIGSPDEAAYQVGNVTKEGLMSLIEAMPESDYKLSLQRILNDLI